ncbi:MAG TPA: hexameric tyrosine-coordinated heme protein [Fodinibius sp.]|nr:hexameric tyrosine-coordinated heme protein [Fodinibius sp.]
MVKYISAIILGITLFIAGTAFIFAQDSKTADTPKQDELSLITDTPEEGFAVAVQLARKGVSTTQPDKDVLFMLRDVYAKDPDALIAASHVVAVHYQTVAAANNYWRD